MTTVNAVLIIVGLALCWEAWTVLNSKPGDTISETVWRATVKQPVIPFLVGFLCGHLFWQSARCMEILGGQ